MRNFTLLGIALISVLTASGKAPVEHVRLPNEIVVHVGDRGLALKNVSISPGWPAYITGQVCNEAGRNWKTVELEIDLRETDGTKIDLGFMQDTVRYYDLEKGKCRPLDNLSRPPSEPRAISVFKPRKARKGVEPEIARVEFRLKQGVAIAAYAFRMIKPAPSDKLEFTDGSLRIRFLPSKEEIAFELQNLTDLPFTIDWNHVSYVDVSGVSHKVVHEGVRLIDRNGQLPPTIVPPTAKVNDMIQPSDSITYDSSRVAGGWVRTPLFPDGDEAKAFGGRKFSIFLPVDSNGKTLNYLFTFEIAKVDY
ncbi:MAG: hypothetical protein JJE04_14005 [Acidobacteriia bacterium]|nr:hypothetical protein [Terriglobia bacterium]